MFATNINGEFDKEFHRAVMVTDNNQQIMSIESVRFKSNVRRRGSVFYSNCIHLILYVYSKILI